MKQKFIICGILGWCMEIIFTGFHSSSEDRRTLTGHTSIWMFPIYGMACLIAPLSRILSKLNIGIRGMIYTIGIFCGEFLSGSFLKKYHLCPWDYSSSRYNVNGLIRLDYAPYWFAAGLFYERILKKMNSISAVEKEDK